MYIEIKGSNGLSINGSLKIKGNPKHYKILNKNEIKLNLYGVDCVVTFKWLYHLTRSRLIMPKGFEWYVTRIRFKNKNGSDRLNNKKRYPAVICFKEPVYFNKDLRIIAEFPNYAISKEKKIYSILENKFLKITENKNATETYPTVYLKTKYAEKEWIQIGVHILAATTWVDNDDYVSKPFVNHKDGDKSNWNAYNLEWVNDSENINHAFREGLREDNVEIKMYDSEKNTISVFSSIREAFKEMGTKAPRSNIVDLFRERNGCYIAKNRYEIRYKNDKSDFLLKTKTASELRKLFFRGYELHQAVNKETNEVLIGTPIKLAADLQMSESGVRGLRLKKTIYKNWIVRIYTEEPVNWKEFREARYIAVKIIATRLSDGEKYTFDSLRKASTIIGCDRKTIQKHMDGIPNGMLNGKWKIEIVKE